MEGRPHIMSLSSAIPSENRSQMLQEYGQLSLSLSPFSRSSQEAKISGEELYLSTDFPSEKIIICETRLCESSLVAKVLK